MVYFNKAAFDFEETNAIVLLGVELNKKFPWDIENVTFIYDDITATGKL